MCNRGRNCACCFESWPLCGCSHQFCSRCDKCVLCCGCKSKTPRTAKGQRFGAAPLAPSYCGGHSEDSPARTRTAPVLRSTNGSPARSAGLQVGERETGGRFLSSRACAPARCGSFNSRLVPTGVAQQVRHARCVDAGSSPAPARHQPFQTPVLPPCFRSLRSSAGNPSRGITWAAAVSRNSPAPGFYF